jgi:HD-GYP domain-containing protein (c-di-GMP phosphodiesterase class II)
LQVADIYDALTTDRPYRTALLPEDAMQVLFREAGNGWLDGSLVCKFFECCQPMASYPARSRSMLVSYFT